MGKIKQLSDIVISKIAAGEVIERPSYAVKELIENAIDSGATQIKVMIDESGLKKIVVTDNGRGMSKEDILLSFLPHTTSKIYSDEELIGIKSLGFRGEALSSIAAISDLTIQSKSKKEKSGTQIHITKSKLINSKPIGMPVGTTVIVQNLFSPVPARKKFLKSLHTEYRHILEIVINNVIANPNIGFEFINNNKQVFYFDKNQSLLEKINILFGEDIFSNLINLNYSDSYLSINGYLGKPQVSFTSSSKIHLFVNKRRIIDSAIVSIIKDSYSNLLERGDYPFAILNLSIPHQFVDVNVHPRKEIIKFVDYQSVQNTFKNSLEETLKTNNLTFYNISWKAKDTNSPSARFLKNIVLNSEIALIGKQNKNTDVIQIHNLYLVTQTKNGIMFIDQHAAHEAILYRHFSDEFKKHKTKSVELKKSVLLSLTISDIEILKEHLNTLEKLGFDFEEFGDNSYKVNRVPKLIKDLNINKTILEILEDLKENKLPKEIDKRSNKMLAYLSCRSAIKSGQKLNKQDIKKLLNQLQKEDYIYTCPHGRPVKIEFSINEFDKLFYRK